MIEWFYSNETFAWWLLILAIVSFVVTLILVPVILIRLPEDYFLQPERHRIPWSDHHPILRIPLLLIKNLLGIVFVISGVLMLALPGQGILTIMVGLILIDFHGKYYLERWIISRRTVIRPINWIRKKSGKPALNLNF